MRKTKAKSYEGKSVENDNHFDINVPIADGFFTPEGSV